MGAGAGPVAGSLVAPPARATQGRRAAAPWYLWAVAAILLVPVAVPFVALVVRAFGGGTVAWDTLMSVRTLELVRNTAVLVVLVTAAAVAIGIGTAWLTERTDLPGRRWWRVAVALPLVIPSYVIALAFISASGPRGLVSDVVGISLPAVRGLTGAWLALAISTYPFVYLVSAAALRRMDPSTEEAARGLGSSQWRVFTTIVLPQLRPAAGAGALLVALYTLSDFGAVSLMRFDAFTRVVYAQYQGRLDRTPAAVLAITLVLLALAVLWVEGRTRGRAGYHSPSPSGPPRTVSLSRAGRRWSLAALAALTAVALAGPVGTLVAWVVRGGSATGRATIDWGALAGSLSGSALAAVIATVAAVPVSVLVVRHSSKATTWVERGVYAAFAIPHITIALAMIFVATRFLGSLYQSLTLLVMVYASIFFAEALGAGRAALLQIDPQLEEASRGLGRGRMSTLTRVTIPLAWRGLAAGGALVFLTAMKELPATLLLRPTGFDTLAVRVWSSANELLYARSAASALVLVAVSAIPMYLLATRDTVRHA